MVETAPSLCFCNSPCRGGRNRDQQGRGCQLFPQGSMLCVPAASRQGFALCLWASVLYLRLLFAAFCKMGPKVVASFREQGKSVLDS